jgi:hypothetical protein
MESITSAKALRESIMQLELKQLEQERLLKEQFALTYQEMKPASIIKRTVKDIFATSDIKDNILGSVLGLAVGYLSKKVAVGSTHNPLKQLLGAILEFGVANAVSKNSVGIGSQVMEWIRNYLSKSESDLDQEKNREV